MKKILLILSIVLCAFSAQAKINVVATLPDFGSLAREIGGDNVSVTVLAKPTEDPHFVDARPSFVVALRSADVLIDGGAELELDGCHRSYKMRATPSSTSANRAACRPRKEFV